ncbi:NADP-dependent isocitrate dehydrogenase [Candidatus Bealeia paramacronuclearis]|uniref:Isocitrate dehydrogenase [NADP] n=1 Tax=Candidatus Bealeia paramacronuclearis TaxID=1921001 RepID=A0ABZ2C6J0_9PROT|nr:NADP-dependent isocitrate dehydrogenase [Candidatus Bealeia paramacronuclearis]
MLKKTITLIEGDGVGPEVTGAARRIIEASGAPVEWEICLAGAKVFKMGDSSGVPEETINSIKRNKVALKGPLETPVGFGEKSANVTIRKLFETYANVRPVREIPGIQTPFSGRHIDMVIVRENVEDLYAGIEYMQTPGVAQGLKIITRKGCEKIARYAFELARAEGRKLVHCATKSNIMKLTEGLLKKTFEEVAKDYPEIEAKHIIIDNCAHQLVIKPEAFDVIVTTNLNGDIISDLASGLVGGLGIAPGSNIGDEVAIFEAVHGSAPDIAGKGIVNPTAVILSSVLMLRHMGLFDYANKIEEALVYTLGETNIKTSDLDPKNPVSTTEFTDEVIKNLGKKAKDWEIRSCKPIKMPVVDKNPDMVKVENRRVVGADIFIESDLDANALGKSLDEISLDSTLSLKMISNRGVQVYPQIADQKPDVVDHWRCRFTLDDVKGCLQDIDLASLMAKIGTAHRWMHVEKLKEFDGHSGFTKAQGEN